MLSPRPIGELLASIFASSERLPQAFLNLLDRLEAFDGRRVPAPDTLSDAEFRKEMEVVLPQLRAYAISLTRDRTIADDLLQDTMIKAWAARDRFRAGTNFRAWSFVIARNIFISERRRGRFKGEWDELAASRLLAAPAPQEHSIHLGDLERAISDLPASQRDAVMLIGAAGLSYEEAAETLQVPVGTVKSRVSRARLALEEALDGVPAAVPVPAARASRWISLRPPS